MKPRKRTDTYPFTFTIRDRDGVAVNTVGYTVTFNVVEKFTRAPKVTNGACVAVDAANGRWKRTPVTADVDTSAAWDVEIKAIAPDGTIYHVPTQNYEALYIRDNLG
jgi:hypothetical protein